MDPADILQVILSFRRVLKDHQLPGDLLLEACPFTRILQLIGRLHHTDLIEEAVLRPVDPLLEFTRPQSLYEFIRIFIRTQIQDFCSQPGLPQDLNIPQGRPDTGVITVIGKDHIFHIAADQGRLSRGKGSTEGGDGLAETGLMHGNDIHIAFAYDKASGPAAFGQVETVQVTALVKDRRIIGIQIFGFAISHHTAAETDDPAVGVLDGKHDPVEETVMQAPLFIKKADPRFNQQGILIPLFLQIGSQVRGPAVRVAQTEFLHGLRTEGPAGQILHTRAASGRTQKPVIISGGVLIDGQELFPLLRPFFGVFGIRGFRQPDTGLVRQLFQRLLKTHVVILHQKSNGIAAGAAAEAVKGLPLAADRKGRRLFIMKGTQAHIAGALFL